MVGHTGVFDAAVKAVETVDKCVKETVEAVLAKGDMPLDEQYIILKELEERL